MYEIIEDLEYKDEKKIFYPIEFRFEIDLELKTEFNFLEEPKHLTIKVKKDEKPRNRNGKRIKSLF